MRIKNQTTSHVQNHLNVLNEDTNVAGEQGFHPLSCGWQCMRTVEDRMRGRLRVKDVSEIVARMLS